MLKVCSDLHFLRRFYHALGVIVIALLYKYLPYREMVILFSFCTILCLGVDLLRLRFKVLNQKMLAVFGGVLRRSEIGGLTGMTFLFVGVLVISLIFPREIVLLTLFMLAIGDPISSIFGILYGKDYLIGKKTLQGTMACFVACTLVAAIYFLSYGLMTERIILASLVAGFIAAISELIPVGGLDDNFTFPIASSCLLWVLFQFMNGL